MADDMREREEQNLRQLSRNSRIMAGAMLHEVRNLCSAISAVYAHTSDRGTIERDQDLQSLDHLMQGLNRIASLDFHSRDIESLEAVSLKEVLDDLRIIIEPAWWDEGGTVRWRIPEEIPKVLADRHGLLQVFLNLAQNSLRAVRQGQARELTVTAAAGSRRVQIRFQDSGCGIPDPRSLFQPFRSGTDSTGLGLYISRSLLRSYGGEMQLEPSERGACFLVELQFASQEVTAGA